jgi:CBS-domain-containing membrane protein
MAAEELMTRDVIMIGPDTPVEAALEIMDQGYFRHLPVCDTDGSLLGIVSIRDLVKFRFAKQEHDVEALKAYVTRSFMH